MIITSAAKRYARALADVAADSGAQESVKHELEFLAAAMTEHPELAGVMKNPAVPPEKKVEIIRSLLALADSELSPLAGNLLGLLISNRRTGLLDQIRAAYQAEIDERMHVVAAEVTIRSELGIEKRSALAKQLEETLGKRMRLSFRKDESIIGGALLRVGSTVYDGSVRRQLEEIRARLAGEV